MNGGGQVDPDYEQANLDQFRDSQKADMKPRRTRLRPEDLLGKPEQNGTPAPPPPRAGKK